MRSTHSTRSTPARPFLIGVGLCFFLFSFSTARADDSYAMELERAAARQAGGDLKAAQAILETLERTYPEDYPVSLRLGWVDFQAGQYAAAERGYRRALHLSSGRGIEALNGLGWTLMRQDRCDEAATSFRAVLSQVKDHAGATEGLSLCRPRAFVLSSSFATTGGLYTGGSKSWGLGGSLSLRAVIAGKVSLFALYRYTEFAPARTSSTGYFGQHEGYFGLGYGVRRWGIQALYALVDDKSGYSGTSHHGGLALRYSPWGDGTLSVSGSFYQDMTVWRAEPMWRLPIGGGLSARLGGAVEWLPGTGEILPAALFGLTLDRRWFSLWAGGKYGEEVRPASLPGGVVMNLPERIEWAGSGGAQLNLRKWTLGVAYEYDRLLNTTTKATGEAQFLSLFLGSTF